VAPSDLFGEVRSKQTTDYKDHVDGRTSKLLLEGATLKRSAGTFALHFFRFSFALDRGGRRLWLWPRGQW